VRNGKVGAEVAQVPMAVSTGLSRRPVELKNERSVWLAMLLLICEALYLYFFPLHSVLVFLYASDFKQALHNLCKFSGNMDRREFQNA
jgi:hypothetical protein